MQTLRIGVTGNIDDIFDILDKGFGKDRNYEFELLIKPKDNEKIDSSKQDNEIIFYSKSKEGLGDGAIRRLSKELTQYILNNYEMILMKQIIEDNYGYYSEAEQEEILEIANLKLQLGEKSFNITNPRDLLIERKLIDYLKSSEYIQIEGFIKFRLKDYLFRLEEYIEQAAEEFIAKREYREFIKLLKYFVEIQNPQYMKIHISIDNDGVYNLFDDKKRDITLECTKSFLSELEEGASFDDVLISYLIMMAPRKIILHGYHNFSNLELLETMKNVFPGRLIICNNCDLCDNIQ